MMASKVALVLACSIMSVAFAGCVSPAYAFSFEAEKGAVDAARDAARDWSATAELYIVAGFEFTDREILEEVHDANATGDEARERRWIERATADEDAHFGDGRLQAWFFFFIDDEGAALELLTDEDGDVLERHDRASAGSAGTGLLQAALRPLDAWKVDAEEAAEAVRETDADWAAALDAEYGILTYGLVAPARGGDEGRPMWDLVLVSDQDGDETTTDDVAVFGAGVDAESGHAKVRSFDQMVPTEDVSVSIQRGSASGSVGMFDRGENPFMLEHEHELLEVGVTMPDASAVPSQGSYRLLDPEGSTVKEGEWQGGDEDLVLSLDAPMMGVWTFEIEMELGLRASYQIEYCATTDAVRASCSDDATERREASAGGLHMAGLLPFSPFAYLS